MMLTQLHLYGYKCGTFVLGRHSQTGILNHLITQYPTLLYDMNMMELWESNAGIQSPQKVRTPHDYRAAVTL